MRLLLSVLASASAFFLASAQSPDASCLPFATTCPGAKSTCTGSMQSTGLQLFPSMDTMASEIDPQIAKSLASPCVIGQPEQYQYTQTCQSQAQLTCATCMKSTTLYLKVPDQDVRRPIQVCHFCPEGTNFDIGAGNCTVSSLGPICGTNEEIVNGLCQCMEGYQFNDQQACVPKSTDTSNTNNSTSTDSSASESSASTSSSDLDLGSESGSASTPGTDLDLGSESDSASTPGTDLDLGSESGSASASHGLVDCGPHQQAVEGVCQCLEGFERGPNDSCVPKGDETASSSSTDLDLGSESGTSSGNSGMEQCGVGFFRDEHDVCHPDQECLGEILNSRCMCSEGSAAVLREGVFKCLCEEGTYFVNGTCMPIFDYDSQSGTESYDGSSSDYDNSASNAGSSSDSSLPWFSQPCGKFQLRSPYSRECECYSHLRMAESGECECPEGFEISEMGVCKCPIGSIRTTAGNCIQKQCREHEILDGSECKCESGFARASSGVCEPRLACGTDSQNAKVNVTDATTSRPMTVQYCRQQCGVGLVSAFPEGSPMEASCVSSMDCMMQGGKLVPDFTTRFTCILPSGAEQVQSDCGEGKALGTSVKDAEDTICVNFCPSWVLPEADEMVLPAPGEGATETACVRECPATSMKVFYKLDRMAKTVAVCEEVDSAEVEELESLLEDEVVDEADAQVELLDELNCNPDEILMPINSFTEMECRTPCRSSQYWLVDENRCAFKCEGMIERMEAPRADGQMTSITICRSRMEDMPEFDAPTDSQSLDSASEQSSRESSNAKDGDSGAGSSTAVPTPTPTSTPTASALKINVASKIMSQDREFASVHVTVALSYGSRAAVQSAMTNSNFKPVVECQAKNADSSASYAPQTRVVSVEDPTVPSVCEFEALPSGKWNVQAKFALASLATSASTGVSIPYFGAARDASVQSASDMTGIVCRDTCDMTISLRDVTGVVRAVVVADDVVIAERVLTVAEEQATVRLAEREVRRLIEANAERVQVRVIANGFTTTVSDMPVDVRADMADTESLLAEEPKLFLMPTLDVTVLSSDCISVDTLEPTICGIAKRTRTLECTLTTATGDEIPVDMQECVDAKVRMPPTDAGFCELPVCASADEDAQWMVSEWSDCSATCGGGVSTRQVECVQVGCSSITDCAVEKSMCKGDMPDTERVCNALACETWKLKISDWSQCMPKDRARQCGEGESKRSARCVSSKGTVDPTYRQCATEYASYRTSGGSVRDCETGIECPELTSSSEALYFWEPVRAWSECSATCGGGFRTKQSTCVMFDLETADLLQTSASDCEDAGLTMPVLQERCNTAPCVAYRWSAGAWSDCTTQCRGVRTRPVICQEISLSTMSFSGALEVADAFCEELSGEKPASEATCNTGCTLCDLSTNPCGDHGTCDRTLVSSTSTMRGGCTCDADWTGLRCEVPKKPSTTVLVIDTDSCESGIFDAVGTCCNSGSIDVDGLCCQKATTESFAKLDRYGECCTSHIDVCGVCGGNSTVRDAMGTCCQQISADGLCCDGVIDSFGVCDGGDQSGLQAVTALMSGFEETDLSDKTSSAYTQLQSDLELDLQDSLQLDSGVEVRDITALARLRRLRRGRALAAVDADVDFSIDGSHGVFTSSEVSSALGANSVYPLQSVEAMYALPVCGNAICEAGERCVSATDSELCCSVDCVIPAYDDSACYGPTSADACSGNGICSYGSDGTGFCSCYVQRGYTGALCDECADGYMPTAYGTCIALDRSTCYDNVQNGGETDVDCGGVCGACANTDDTSTDSANKANPLTSVPLMACYAFAGVALVAFTVKRRSQKPAQPPQRRRKTTQVRAETSDDEGEDSFGALNPINPTARRDSRLQAIAPSRSPYGNIE